MKLTYTESSVGRGLLLEADDGLFATSFIDRKAFDCRGVAAVAIMAKLIVSEVNAMFESLEARRTSTPVLGATMQTKCGRVRGVVTFVDTEATTCRIENDDVRPWSEVEYAE